MPQNINTKEKYELFLKTLTNSDNINVIDVANDKILIQSNDLHLEEFFLMKQN